MKKDKEWLKNEMLNLRNASNRVMVVAIGEVMELIDQLDEPKKVVVPQWFDEWVEENHEDTILMIKNISQIGYGHTFEVGMSGDVYKPNLSGGLSIHHDEIYDNKEKYIRAVLDGYEIEKERLYYVRNGAHDLMLARVNSKINPTFAMFEFAAHKGNLELYQLTEKEIKDYDERYWPFAEEVAE